MTNQPDPITEIRAVAINQHQYADWLINYGLREGGLAVHKDAARLEAAADEIETKWKPRVFPKEPPRRYVLREIPTNLEAGPLYYSHAEWHQTRDLINAATVTDPSTRPLCGDYKYEEVEVYNAEEFTAGPNATLTPPRSET
jgi:hypothetical protein